MKNYIAIVGIYFLFMNSVFSQGRGNIWCFGDSCQINFNNNPPTTDYSVIRSRGTACSISDSSGNLLFYCGTPHIDLWQSGGTFFVGSVYNNYHQIMENGDSLATELSYNEMVIIPDPNYNRSYYLFYLHICVAKKPILRFGA